MPNSTDNQDYKNEENSAKDAGRSSEKATGPAQGNLPLSANSDEGNFTSDNQKGKKVDGDPSLESDQPAKI